MHSPTRPEGVPGICESDASSLERVMARYPFRATPYYLSLIDWEDPADPVRLQCLPDARELDWTAGKTPEGWGPDPFDEAHDMPAPGLVHRFPDRALILAATECAVNCRHCTRKNTLSAIGPGPGRERFEAALAYIAAHPGIREVIISGGDPLLLEDSVLDRLLGSLTAIGHVEVLRLGTRVPVVLPMRLDAELCDMLATHRPLWVNTQFNHPVEVTPDAVQACEMLLQCGIPVSNQCVLLRGVNDSAETMRKLCNALQRNMIRPYYVLQCDPVAGTEHFRTELSAGGDMAETLRRQVGGLSLPRFVADVPGEAGKVPL